jgi:predicted adenine nucleotide alpha hydrolase (AANH) superfamily ATPase
MKGKTMIDLQEILSKMNPNQKVNYDRVMQQMVKVWEKEDKRPSILVHVCCAPCSTYTLEYLSQYADITVYFANSNIHPKDEYKRRAYVTQKFVSNFNEKTGQSVRFLEAPYEPNEFFRTVHGLEDEPEGGDRCRVCFDYRLDKTAQKAVDLGFDYFASALTISPHKNSQTINTVGIDVQKLYTAKYLPSDFKKNNGYRRSVEMCEEYDVYRQCYCGCIFAAKAQGVDLVQTKKDAKEFMSEKDGEREFPQIRFVYQGKEM